ncbi:MAG: hypothetical protein IIZ92_19850 [Aquincola sp.]|nr:hypothetical protein [Aquincola sp.]
MIEELMVQSSPNAPHRGLLELGLSDAEEAVYRSLLSQPGSDPRLLQSALQETGASLAEVLQQLAQRGLATFEPSLGNGTWFATPPELAVELLMVEQYARLNIAKRVVDDLKAQAWRAESASHPSIQILEADPEPQLHAYLDLFSRARQDIRIVVRRPFAAGAPQAAMAARLAARKRGVALRTLVSADVLAMKGWADAVTEAQNAGEDLRVAPAVPLKMVIADGQRALLPLSMEAQSGPALLTADTSVVHLLVAEFERLWRNACPIDSVGSAAPPLPLETWTDELLAALASGLNDKGIAYQLGISERTLQRRISALCEAYGAESRFQLGWLAARHSPH